MLAGRRVATGVLKYASSGSQWRTRASYTLRVIHRTRQQNTSSRSDSPKAHAAHQLGLPALHRAELVGDIGRIASASSPWDASMQLFLRISSVPTHGIRTF